MIHDILPINSYIGNDTSVTFDFDFYVENENQMNVYLYNPDGTKTKLIYSIDYSISEFKNINGGYITYPLESSTHSILSTNERILLELTLPISQETIYNNGSSLNFKSIEYSFDYVTRLIQILSARINNCIEVNDFTSQDVSQLIQKIVDCAAIAQQAYENMQQYGQGLATTTTPGVVKIGAGISIDSDGEISVPDSANKNLNNLNTLGNSRLEYSHFALNSGTISNGKNNTLTYSGSTITCAPCTITTADGRTLVDSQSATYDVSNTPNGSYYIFKNYSTKALFLFHSSKFAISKTIPMKNAARADMTTSNFTGNGGQYAFDGSTSSQAQSGTTITIANNAYLGQTGLNKPVEKIRIYQGTSASNYCSSIKLQYSNDGSTWSDIQTVSNCSYAQWQTINVNSYNPTGATHSFRIRAVTFAGTQGTNNWIVQELELYTKCDYWLDTSSTPANLKLYDSGSYTNNNSLVCIGECSVSSGAVSSLKNYPINDNGYSSGTSTTAALAMPSGKHDNLTLGASGSTFSAPTNGYISFAKTANASGQYIMLVNQGSGIGIDSHATSSSDNLRVFLPVLKGDTIQVNYNAAGSTINFRFIYAKGSESEAN